MEIVSGIHLIPHWMVNCYLIVEPDGVTLIDAGISERSVLKYLEGLGRPLTDLKRIIITHADPDHVGALADLAAASGAQIYASPIEAQAIAAGRASRPLPSLLARMVVKILRTKPARVDHSSRTGRNCRSGAD
ncbi:MAG: MBL fold metallo-hydrolase [Dermatophilaceae bacterium]